MSRATDQATGGLSPEDEELLSRYGSQPGLGQTGEEAAEEVSEATQTEQGDEPGQAPRQESPASDQRREEPAGEHPENLPFLSLEPDEAAAELRRRLEEDPAEIIQRLKNGTLRLSDYTRKTKEAAELRREAEELARQFQDQQQRAQQQPSQEQRDQQQQGRPPQGPQMMDVETFARWFEQEHGREPTQADYVSYRVDAMVEPLVEKKVQERVGAFEQSIREREVAQIQDRLVGQYEELCEEFPEAGDPSVQMELASLLAQLDTDLSGGDEVRRAYLYAHPEVLEKAREGALEGRQKQVERRESEAPQPPGGGGIDTAQVTPKSTNLDDIAETQKKDPALIERLVGTWRSMRGE